jgi:glycogen operon protein
MIETAAAASASLTPGSPYPLGATVTDGGVNFAVFSANARRIYLCLFDETGTKEIRRLRLPQSTNQVFHGFLKGAGPGTVYGLRAFGRYDPIQGQRFNAHKLLLDPYARQIVGVMQSHEMMRADRVGHPDDPESYIKDRRDSAPVAPKARVVVDRFDWGDEKRPNTPLASSVIYEAHVRGLSFLREDLDKSKRGTFAALADPKFIAHLKHLGVTALELLPVHAVLHDRFLLAAGLCNFWGYNNVNFFAVNPQYLASDHLDEVRAAIRDLHNAGIEVILDVVYNHSGEGSERGPTVSFRGLDNQSYYLLDPNAGNAYVNDTGCGNTIQVSHPRVTQMVLDSLRYWVSEMHVDGFRFDLAPTLGRDPFEYRLRAGFFVALMQDPVLSKVKLIAEPWDVGWGGYRVGEFPTGFSEWNDKYRDCVRRFWRGDDGMRGEFAARLSGSPDLFEHDGRGAEASVNFVTAHDGFTMTDLVSYATKHNLANGENNRDGSDNNWSSNWGDRDASDDPAVCELRERVKRAMLITLFMSHGVPMLLGGDEFGRSQGGNNNAYCQDSAISWIDWGLLEQPRGKSLTRFVARLAALRREIPVARSERFLHGAEVLGELRDVEWFDSDGRSPSWQSWQDGRIKTLALRRVGVGPENRPTALLVLFNASQDVARFVLPKAHGPWRIRLNADDPDCAEELLQQETVDIAAHSACILSAV